MPITNIEIVDLSQKGITKEEARDVAKWMARAFAQARKQR